MVDTELFCWSIAKSSSGCSKNSHAAPEVLWNVQWYVGSFSWRGMEGFAWWTKCYFGVTLSLWLSSSKEFRNSCPLWCFLVWWMVQQRNERMGYLLAENSFSLLFSLKHFDSQNYCLSHSRNMCIIYMMNRHTCTRNAMSTTNVVITPITSPRTPLATVEEPMSTSIYKKNSVCQTWRH